MPERSFIATVGFQRSDRGTKYQDRFKSLVLCSSHAEDTRWSAWSVIRSNGETELNIIFQLQVVLLMFFINK